MSQSEGYQGDSVSPLLQLKRVLNTWRDQLVSFDGRNRQLFYRRLKSGDVDFNDKDLDKAVLNLLINEKPIKVSNLYPKIYSNLKNRNQIDLSLEENLDDDESDEVEELTNAEIWAGKLRKYEAVYRKAKENFDEKNIETCFLAQGFITWQQTKPGPTPNAPLVLHPIKIEPTARGNADFQLLKTEDSFFNQALVLYLQKEFGLDAKIFEIDTEEGLTDNAISQVINKLQALVPGFEYSAETVLGNFSFLKYPMVQDINRIIDTDTTHMLLSALAGNDQAVQKVSESGTEKSLEELSELNPINENLVFPADSSQHLAISAVLGGKSVVIQGPPGSGKSQTIANLIAESVIHNKKILFVAEKRAAIDAVVERLNEKGLGGVVLDLHGEPDKKTIAKNLLSAIKSYGLPQPLTNNELTQLQISKKRLNERWKWLDKNSGIWNENGVELTNYEILTELGELRNSLKDELIRQADLLSKNFEGFDVRRKNEVLNLFSDLHNLSYFTKEYQSSEALKDLKNLKDDNSAITFVEALQNLESYFESPFWKRIKRLFKSALNKDSKNILEFKQSFGEIRTHIEFQRYFDVSDIETLELLSSACLPLSRYRNIKQSGFFSSIFSRRREFGDLKSRMKAPFAGDKTKIRELILEESKVLEKWPNHEKLTQELTEIVSEFEPILKFIEELLEQIKKVQEIVPDGFNAETLTFDELQSKIKNYLPVKEFIKMTPAINQRLQGIYASNLTSALYLVIEFKLDNEKTLNVLNLAWLNANLRQDIAKQSFWKDITNSLTQETEKFSDLDSKHLRANTTKILSHLTNNYSRLPIPDKTLLTRESEKKHSHLPFRKLLERIPESIQLIKPVMAMSPLAVSRMLPCKEGMFDIVIFDEASQVKPEDAITSIYRGKQLVVAGDRFQLPPTNFGEKTLDEDVRDFDSEDYLDPATMGMESILTSAIGIFSSDRNIKPLKLHYRSRDERLISWSNYHIYKNAGEELFTFPSLDVQGKTALRYSYLPKVRTQSMSVSNEAEIKKVKEIVLEHIAKTPEKSLGIIAFGMRHSIRLQDEFNLLEKESDSFYAWKSSWAEKREKFFIKNIERVQGDERDSIIITPGYAPNLDGNVPLQFGTLNRQGGERRLNVAASRSKDYMHLVTSLRSTDIDLKRSKATSISLFRSFLEFMENEGRLSEADYELSVPTTPFESEILERLTKAGLLVDCQVGDSGFKIDFAVRDPKSNKYLLAIEADGATYHSSEYARERDYMRQRILESRGWRFIRIWSTDWWQNPEAEVERVLNALKSRVSLRTDELPSRTVKPNSGSSRYEDIEEFLILRGIKDKNQGKPRDVIFELWFKAMGFQRRTENLNNRFMNYWKVL